MTGSKKAKSSPPAGRADAGDGKADETRREDVEAAALYVLVFVCGTILMSAEIAGSRVLSPFYGSAIFVWGSLIGVVMVAMAAGYYVGGRVADARPSFPLLCAIVGGAGIFLMVMPAFSTPLCAAIDRGLEGPRTAPLLSSVLLFLVPGMLLAAVSPFAVRLSARELSQLGNVAGRLYALSTTGSIVGTLGTAFLLIPLVGVRQLIFALGIALVLTAAAGFVAVRRFGRGGGPAVGFVAAAAVLGLVAFPSGPGAEITPHYEKSQPHTLVEWRDSAYHLILVTEQDYKDPATAKKRPRRCLRFNDRLQSAIWLDNLDVDPATGRLRDYAGYESAVGYTDLLHMGIVFCPDARRALFVGGGGGIGPTEFVRDYGMEVDIAEIDPEVERFSRKYFYVHDAVKFHVGDGRRVLKKLPGPYDLIVLDAYSSGGHIPAHLTTVEFLELCRSRLSPGGVVVSNVISVLEGKGSNFYQSEYLTMYAAGFGNVYTFPKYSTPEQGTSREQYQTGHAINIIIVATQDEARLDQYEILRRARELTKRKEHPMRSRHLDYLVFRKGGLWDEGWTRRTAEAEMDRGIVLTDDYCPVDTMFYDR